MRPAPDTWQENMRYGAETGTNPLARRTGVRRHGRGFVVALLGLSALIAMVSYARRGSNDTAGHATTHAASVTPGAAKTRSFTRNVTSKATPALAEPASAQASADAVREHATVYDPVATGAISVPNGQEAPREASVAAAGVTSRPTLDQARRSSRPRFAQARSRDRPQKTTRLSKRSRLHLAYRPRFHRVASVCLLFCF